MIHSAFEVTPTLAASVVLVSIIKPLLLIPQFVIYLRLASSVIENDARRLHIGVNGVNIVMMTGAIVALAVGILVPIFWIGWPVSILILAGMLWGYMQWRNAKVPEAMKFELIGTRLEDARQARASRRAEKAVDVKFIDPNGKEHEVPLVENPMHTVHKELETILGPALEANASTMHFVPGKQGTTIVRVVDTVQYKQDVIASETASAAIDYLKSIALLDVEDRRRIQEGEMKLLSPSGIMQFHLKVSGSSAGQRATIELDRAKRLGVGFKKLGLQQDQREALESLDLPESRHGVVLIITPEGHGVSTIGYALIGRHDAFSTVVKTCEKHVDLELQAVDQKEWNPETDEIDFTTTVRSILRRDPDVLLVDDITDPGCAEIIARSGLDGPLIYVEVRARALGDGIQQWVRAVGDLNRASTAIRAVVIGRVLRRLCPACRQPYQPDPAQLAKLGLAGKTTSAEKTSTDSETSFHRAGGKVQVKNKVLPCDACNGIGYTGTIGVFEVLPLDDAARKLMGKNDLKGAYRHIRRETRLPLLQEAALGKVTSGKTSIDEVMRVLAPPAAKKNATQKTTATDKPASPPTPSAS